MPFLGVDGRNGVPSLAEDVFVAPNASVIGDVEIGAKSSIWYGAALRGDLKSIKIGEQVSIGDNCTVNTSSDAESAANEPVEGVTVIGNRVTIGNGSTLYSCTVEDESSVEMGAVIGRGAHIEKHAVVKAGSVVPDGARIPAGEMWAGAPAEFVRKLTDAEQKSIAASTSQWFELAQHHLKSHNASSSERLAARLADQDLGTGPDNLQEYKN
jgi:gamma-carbonic anhydrase